ncbi:conjugal transfer protein TraF [Endozoicomonas gorgoniicola]|uniref:Conjugal transfer protein TraF n=1 Tax=Endozoicomonas gorgoniicola TaxID=1234144 RepID=A0ABT3MWI2_9GAMM|nr:conjugal transfer protein TraF [Endozoicomonas gorgoniicola]MCW7553728.1 conjugal transfer protein TraF [Endozoicomonas gorgoniicola]
MRALHLLLLFSTTLVDAGADERWFDRHSEGWFWYEPLDDESTGEDSPQPMKITPQQSLSAAWIRQNIGQYLDRAIDEPSKENVSNYLYLDRMVKEKGEQFARVGKQVIESDPMLDENVRRPISPAAAKIKDDMAHQAKEEILRKVAKIAGLVFYYRGNCKLCHLQAQSVQLMKEHYGFELPTFTTQHDIFLIPAIYQISKYQEALLCLLFNTALRSWIISV